ncbi:MAG: ABC transporter substrate-binding protein [Proteobacteria bacterium]|nr:ABC transporter substrate-binding protein [Pseudomonadota bacterium]MBI3496939.1 ABC transporter substrate-binding protein [Pseudomonadota bacterium]
MAISTKRWGAWAAAAIVPLALAAGPTPAAAQKTLNVVLHADLKVLDPIWTTADITRYYGWMVYDQLFAQDLEGGFQPQMVDNYNVSQDGLTYTFALRDGLKFHDGNPVTTADVVQSLKRWAARDGAGQILYKFVKDVAAVDAKTFKMTLSEPYGLVLDSIGKYASLPAFIMPKRLADTDPQVQVTEATGSGPFKFVRAEWNPGSKAVYVKNADYVPRKEAASMFAGGKVVKVDRVEWVYMPDEQTQVSALDKGEVDFVETPRVDLLPVLRKNSHIKIEPLDKVGNVGILRPNHLHPPFNNVKARQALLWIVNQDDYLQAISGADMSLATKCGAILVCGTPMANETGSEALLSKEPKAARMAKAKALMAEAGYKGEPIILLEPSDNPSLHAAGVVLTGLMREAGLNVDQQTMEWGTLVTRRAKKEPPPAGWNIFQTSGGFSDGNPAFSIIQAANCEKAWFGWPCDESLEKLRLDWAKAKTLDERKKIALDIQKRAMETVPWINYGQWVQPVAYRDGLKGLLVVPETVLFWNVEKG